MQCELQHAEGIGVADFACRKRRGKWTMAFAPCADYNLANAVLRIEFAVRILACEPLIVMIVPHEDERRMSGVEVIPKRLYFWIIPVLRAGTEEGLVPVRGDTRGRMRLQICS
jgi:hypothetical protein